MAAAIEPSAHASVRVELRSNGAPLAWYPVSALRDALAHLDRVASRVAEQADVRVVLVDAVAGEVTLAGSSARLAA